MKMDIGNIGKQTYSYCETTKQTATRNNKLFSAADQKADVEETLRYYRELCSEFPEVSFRLDDETNLFPVRPDPRSFSYLIKSHDLLRDLICRNGYLASASARQIRGLS